MNDGAGVWWGFAFAVIWHRRDIKSKPIAPWPGVSSTTLMWSRLSRQTTFSGKLPGVLVPNLGGTKQRNADKAPQIQVAALIQP